MIQLPYVDPRLSECLQREGITRLRHCQNAALQAGVTRGQNILVSSPSASGKTLVGWFAVLQCILNDAYAKAFYLVPVSSMVHEKSAKFEKACRRLRIRLVSLLKDEDIVWNKLTAANVVVCPYDVFSIILRKMPPWLSEIKCVVLDDIHSIRPDPLGVVMEGVVTRVRTRLPKAQLVALSTTIANANELADWLRCSLVESCYRSVPLNLGVTVADNQLQKIKELSSHVIKQGGQVLIFVRSRSISQQYTKALAEIVEPWLTNHEREELRDAAKSITEFRVAGGPGYLGIMGDLPPMLHKGVSFYHTGLLYGIRKIIEDEFKKRNIKLVCCTTAPESSVTTPARIVILTDTMYFRPGPKGRRRLERMDNNTVHQILGRTGQMDFDSQAFGIVMAKDDDERTRLINEYFTIAKDGSLEAKFNPISSGLDDEQQLVRQVMLEAFDHDGVTQDHLNEFFKKTFYAHQRREDPRSLDPILTSLSFTINDVIRSRSSPNIYQKAIGSGAKVKINSSTKNKIEGSVQSSSKPDSWHKTSFDKVQGPTCDCKYYRFRGRRDGILCRHLICLGIYCSKSSKYHQYAEDIIPELLNGDSLTKQMIQDGFLNIEDEKLYCTRLGILTVKMLLEPQVVSFIRDTIHTQAITENKDILTLITSSTQKSQVYTLDMRNIDIFSNVIMDWINELSIVEIARRYKIYPNDIFSIINSSSKLARSISGIAKIQHKKKLENASNVLAQRIRWGVKEELLEIMNTAAPGLNRGVGRQLFDAGYKTIKQLSTASIEDISAQTRLSKGRITRILKSLKPDMV